MEGGVKGHDLRNIRKDGLDGVDAQDMGRIVERGEIRADFDLLHHVVIDEFALGEILSSLNYAVADSLNVVKRLKDSCLRVDESLKDELHTLGMVLYRKILHDLLFSSSSELETSDRESDLFSDTFCDDIEDIIVLHVKKLVFDGRASAIDDKNNHFQKFMLDRIKISKKTFAKLAKFKYFSKRSN